MRFHHAEEGFCSSTGMPKRKKPAGVLASMVFSRTVEFLVCFDKGCRDNTATLFLVDSVVQSDFGAMFRS